MNFRPIDSTFQRKLTEAAAFLVRLRGGRMHHLKLVKLMYLADRRSLVELGSTITWDEHKSMEYGPVGDGLTKMIWSLQVDENETVSEPFSKSFWRPNRFEIELREDASESTRELSRAEKEILKQVFEEHGHKNRFSIVDETHKLPEWMNPKDSEADSLPIEHERILKTEGYDEQQLREHKEQEEHQARLKEIFS